MTGRETLTVLRSRPRQRARRTFRLGPFMVSTCNQAPGCPIIDGGASSAVGGSRTRWGVLVICPTAAGGRALVLGWRGANVPHPERWRWLPSALTRFRPDQ